MTTTKDIPDRLPRRLYSLDVIRGLAALLVVCGHWRLLFYDGTAKGSFAEQRLPFRPVLSFAFGYAGFAVDMFFCLSGFVFFWLYAAAIAERKIGFKEFALLRFSRLYPLHFVTLLLVLLGQTLMWRYSGSYFVYSCNDAYHFILQLFFASQWGFEKDLSFNGPVWSISVEILLYMAFFVVCMTGRRRWWHLVILVLLGPLLMKTNREYELGRGIFSFFVGGLAFYFFVELWNRRLFARRLWLLVALLLFIWVAVPVNYKYGILYRGYHALFGRWRMLNGPGSLLTHPEYSLTGFLFPLTIIFCALLESYRGSLGKQMAFLGDISYSTYLLHFPLQLALMDCVYRFGFDKSILYNKGTFLAFFAVLIPLSFASHYLFERPAQKFFRNWLFAAPAKRAAGRGLERA